MVGDLVLAQRHLVGLEQGGQQIPVLGASQIEGHPTVFRREQATASIGGQPSLACQVQ